MDLDRKQTATIVAALHLLHQTGFSNLDPALQEIATLGESAAAMKPHEIDELIISLNEHTAREPELNPTDFSDAFYIDYDAERDNELPWQLVWRKDGLPDAQRFDSAEAVIDFVRDHVDLLKPVTAIPGLDDMEPEKALALIKAIYRDAFVDSDGKINLGRAVNGADFVEAVCGRLQAAVPAPLDAVDDDAAEA